MTDARLLAVGDLLLYGLALTAAVCAVTFPLSHALTESLTPAKWLLFVVASVLLLAGAVKMRPKPAWKDETRLGMEDSRGEGRLQSVVDRTMPEPIDDARRYSDGLKLLVGSLLMFLVSFLLERVLGVPG